MRAEWRLRFQRPGEATLEPDGGLPRATHCLLHPVRFDAIGRVSPALLERVNGVNIVSQDRPWHEPGDVDRCADLCSIVVGGDAIMCGSRVEPLIAPGQIGARPRSERSSCRGPRSGGPWPSRPRRATSVASSESKAARSPIDGFACIAWTPDVSSPQSMVASPATIAATMYNKFFGLRRAPFSIAPDPRYLFMSERHREALAHLLYGVGGGGGFVLLTGEIGAGKTTVCRCFLEQVPRKCNVAYLFNPKQTTEELLGSICDEFRVPPDRPGPGAPTVKDHVDALNKFLLRTHAVGQNNVLIIDEAQSLSADVLEQLRLLTNLETAERKLLQIILIGQPELRDILARPELEQLAQRVIARYHLEALTGRETAQYIHHRLTVAGLTRAVPFDAAAIQRVHDLARGVPRRINLLCDRALLGAYATGQSGVTLAIVEQAATEVLGERPRVARRRARLPWRWRLSAALGLGLVLGAALFGLASMAWQAAQQPAAPATRAEGK